MRELRRFAKVHAGRAEEYGCSFHLGMRDLAFWDPGSDEWVAEAGEYLVWAGTSSRALSEPVSFVLTERWTAPASAPI